jgi:uncharacterized RDD family membrane protein YckC
MSWHYAIGGQQTGPVSDEVFSQLVKAGTIGAETLVWREGWSDWRAYGTVNADTSGAPTTDPDTAVCAVSGLRLPKSEMFEYEGRWVGVEHKEEFFQRLREGVNLPQDVVYGGFWRRFLAKVLDTIILLVVNMIVGAVIGGVIGGITAASGRPVTAVALLIQISAQLAGIAMTLAYAIYFTRKFDATPGKKALGLRLLRADGSKLSKRRIVGRYFAEWISSAIMCVGYLMVAFDKEQHRALHDRICDTRVIDVRGR